MLTLVEFVSGDKEIGSYFAQVPPHLYTGDNVTLTVMGTGPIKYIVTDVEHIIDTVARDVTVVFYVEVHP